MVLTNGVVRGGRTGGRSGGRTRRGGRGGSNARYGEGDVSQDENEQGHSEILIGEISMGKGEGVRITSVFLTYDT